MRNAILISATVEVVCPACGEAQPSPSNGSHLWLPQEVSAYQGQRACVACDEVFRLLAQNRAQLEAS